MENTVKDLCIAPIIINDKLYRISDICASRGISKTLIFQAAAASEIELLFEKPHALKCVLRLDEFSQNYGTVRAGSHPEWLAVPPQHCKLLGRTTSITVYQCHYGYRGRNELPIYAKLEASCARPYESSKIDDDYSMVRERHNFSETWKWAFVDATSFRHVSVAIQDIHVRHSEFESWYSRHYLNNVRDNVYEQHGFSPKPKASIAHIPFEIQVDDTTYISDKLKRMFEAADLFWNNPCVAQKQYPAADWIVEWFLTLPNNLFTRNTAEDAQQMIVPSFAANASRSPKRNKHLPTETKEAWLSKCGKKGDRRA